MTSISVLYFCSSQQSKVKFHFIGLKCASCGGYNTTQNIKTRNFTFSNSNGTNGNNFLHVHGWQSLDEFISSSLNLQRIHRHRLDEHLPDETEVTMKNSKKKKEKEKRESFQNTKKLFLLTMNLFCFTMRIPTIGKPEKKEIETIKRYTRILIFNHKWHFNYWPWTNRRNSFRNSLESLAWNESHSQKESEYAGILNGISDKTKLHFALIT